VPLPGRFAPAADAALGAAALLLLLLWVAAAAFPATLFNCTVCVYVFVCVCVRVGQVQEQKVG
jgi:hypothetical protein